MLVLTECRFLVLDEADRMIDMNYEDALHAILDCLPAQRTTMLYSATMPPTVDRMARTYLQQPLTIVIGQAGQAVGTVEQRVEMIHSEAERLQGTLQALDSGLAPPMMASTGQALMHLVQPMQSGSTTSATSGGLCSPRARS